MQSMFEPLESRTLLSAAGYTHAVHGWRNDPVAVATRGVSTPVTAPNVLKVAADRRSLVHDDGTPFFYLADTAWELFNKLSRTQAKHYLNTRAAQGFTVIQAEINARFGANVYGDAPFIKNDVTRPNEAFFQHMDYVINRANALGMYVSLVPLDSTWSQNGTFNVDNVYQFGKFLGRRYAKAKIIWVLGGDVPGDGGTNAGRDMWRNLAAGITRGAANRDESKVLMTYHPDYNHTATQWFANDSWLDFDAIQSGHSPNKDNYAAISADYIKNPRRPVIDIESGYENIPAGIVPGATRLTDYDTRKSAYWSLFAGSFGVTFGNNNVWQFASGPNKRNLASTAWTNALDTPGASSMKNLKRLMLSRPMLNRVPDQSLIVGSTLSGTDHLQATRAADGSYAFVYTASGKAVSVNLNKLSGRTISARWYNPRSGKSAYLGDFAKSGNRTFTAPSSGAGNDWVLVLDDASKRYGKP